MMINKLYALDFDGVICDSAIETGISGWQVARQLWSDMPAEVPVDTLTAFRQVRPVMETGYEAILIMRSLFQQISPQTLLSDFHTYLQKLIQQNALSISDLKHRFGQFRDSWIARDISHWIAMNPLFPGVAEKLQQLDTNNTYIITTKQERFVQQILAANDVELPSTHIYGLDRKLSKPQILTDLSAEHPQHSVLFVEDRLPTLFNVIDDKRLQHVELYFADWGYNTTEDKQQAQQTDKITSINLSQWQAL